MPRPTDYPAWVPDPALIQTTHLQNTLKTLRLPDYPALHRYSTTSLEDFWTYVIERLAIPFDRPPERLVDRSLGDESPRWLPNARMNIVNACFQAPTDQVAIIQGKSNGTIQHVRYGELQSLAYRVAASLSALGFQPGDPIAIDLPMTMESVAVYLGIIAAGCVMVAIADSFAPAEIATRLTLTQTKAIFTQDVIVRDQKCLPLYKKVCDAGAPQAIVLAGSEAPIQLQRPEDRRFNDFLQVETDFTPVACDPNDPVTILFSSGTTGTPKAIPWTHTTPIKCASDAYFHHDLHVDDRFAWPTNLGWMMGPWLIYATLINRSTMVLFDGAPTTHAFARFVQDAKVTVLGLVPSLVKAWRHRGVLTDLNWDQIKLFTSTGECSNADDMAFLMAFAGNKPMIEYCGGTEIGGAYLTSTLLQPIYPGCFTTPALGLDFLLLDDAGNPADKGEVALLGPSIGLSTILLNQDHHAVYYAGMPKSPEGRPLRRHGDQIEKLSADCYRAQGRVDDTMNLGGIKTSAASIERCLNRLDLIEECAAVALNPPGGGPSQLVIFAVACEQTPADRSTVKALLQTQIKTALNPLFKIERLEWIEALPRTASNKIMRRVLREGLTD